MKNRNPAKKTIKFTKFRNYLSYLRIKFRFFKFRKNRNRSLDVRYFSDHLKKDIGVYDKDH